MISIRYLPVWACHPTVTLWPIPFSHFLLLACPTHHFLMVGNGGILCLTLDGGCAEPSNAGCADWGLSLHVSHSRQVISSAGSLGSPLGSVGWYVSWNFTPLPPFLSPTGCQLRSHVYCGLLWQCSFSGLSLNFGMYGVCGGVSHKYSHASTTPIVPAIAF